jgi:hypothetical protein
MPLPSDLIDLLSEFEKANVRYLLVGGQALAFHGVPRFTKDADLWIENREDNLRSVEKSLAAFGAPRGTYESLRDAEELDVVWLGHPPARIDLMKGVPGGNFGEAWSTRKEFVAENVNITCVDRRTLIDLKRASGRPQDLLDVEHLERFAH